LPGIACATALKAESARDRQNTGLLAAWSGTGAARQAECRAIGAVPSCAGFADCCSIPNGYGGCRTEQHDVLEHRCMRDLQRLLKLATLCNRYKTDGHHGLKRGQLRTRGDQCDRVPPAYVLFFINIGLTGQTSDHLRTPFTFSRISPSTNTTNHDHEVLRHVQAQLPFHQYVTFYAVSCATYEMVD
jgi:hypothetical protein